MGVVPLHSTPAPYPLLQPQLPPPLPAIRPKGPVINQFWQDQAAESLQGPVNTSREHTSRDTPPGAPAGPDLTPPAVHLNVKPSGIWLICITESVRPVYYVFKLCGAQGVVINTVRLINT